MQLSDMAYWLLVQQSAWIVGLLSVYMTWQMGNRKWWAPWLGLFGQGFWTVLALYSMQYGLLLSVACYTVVHIRNGLKWRKELKEVPHG